MRRLPTIFLLCMTSCVQLGPDLRSSEADLQGALVAGCKNVKAGAVLGGYDTGFYRTTWGSAWKEGASAGLAEGLSSNETRVTAAVRAALLKPVGNEERVFVGAFSGPQPYCRVYQSSRKAVADSVANMVRSLGHDMVVSDARKGIFRLGLVERSHRAAKWKEGYIMTVTEERTNRVVLRILRNVYISRAGDDYFQGDSDGHNEAWIMQEVANSVAAIH